GAIGAVHVSRKAEDDDADLVALDDLRDVLHGVGDLIHMHRFERMGEHAELVGDREADAGFAMVDAERALHCKAAGTSAIRCLMRSASCRLQTSSASAVCTTMRS